VLDRQKGPDLERAIAYKAMQQSRFTTASIPFYAIFSPNGDVIASFDGATKNEARYEAFLKRGLSAAR
jgi:hypothetical protein